MDQLIPYTTSFLLRGIGHRKGIGTLNSQTEKLLKIIELCNSNSGKWDGFIHRFETRSEGDYTWLHCRNHDRAIVLNIRFDAGHHITYIEEISDPTHPEIFDPRHHREVSPEILLRLESIISLAKIYGSEAPSPAR
jgi:hypothetical protein